jgi:hypothetical protein
VHGIADGTASFFRHVATGSLSSVSGFASSVGRNADKLTMNAEQVQRRQSLHSGGAGSRGSNSPNRTEDGKNNASTGGGTFATTTNSSGGGGGGGSGGRGGGGISVGSAAVVGLGYSLLSAVAGVVDEPLHQLAQDKPTTAGFIGGLGRGFLGLVTK